MQTFRVGADIVDVDVLVADAADPFQLVFADGVEAAVRANSVLAAALAAEGVAYGRTTGVGANRDVSADDRDGGHGLRLVRSHSTGHGADLGVAVARGTMLIRLAQLSIPGSGIPFEVVDALRRAANDGRTPVVREFGAMGTGDIAPLAELALCLLGERQWRDGETVAYLDHLDGSGALSFMSSSAATLALAARGAAALDVLLAGSLRVSALGAAAVHANPQQWSVDAAATRPSPGVERACAALRAVLDAGAWTPARTQDPLSWRVIPFLAGPALDVASELRTELRSAMGAGAENPRFTEHGVVHHGSFNLTSLGLRLDTARLALVQWSSSSLARLVKLHDPAYTDGGRFLADGPAGSSGLMVVEYTAGSALETVRTLADPTSRHTTSISLGTEDHASFATRGAVALLEQVQAATVVVACELVAAVRALRQRDLAVMGSGVRSLLAACDELPASTDDRPLVDDLDVAVRIVEQLGRAASV
jgi:histidine ammonia-lyase